MNNVSLGNSTESQLSTICRQLGFWCHILKKSNSGSQPFDLIAVSRKKELIVLCVDGKHVRKNESSFTFNRIEDNQESSFSYLHNFAGLEKKYLGFGIQFEKTGEIYWLSYEKYLEYKEQGRKSINLNELPTFFSFLNLTNENIVV